MKKYLTIIAAAAICLLTACSKEKELRAPAEEQNIAEEVLPANGIKAIIGEVSTSASVDDATAAFSWNTGDKIAVWSGSSYQISDALASTYDGSNSAIFSFGSDINADRADFAVFPASLVSSGSSASAHTAESLKISLPSSYTLDQVQGEVSPTPLIAVNAPGASLAFKSVCALLRLDVHCIAKDAEYLKISFPGQKVNGEFTLANFVAGTDGVQGSASSDEDEETITIEDLGTGGSYIESLVVNIPLPMGSYDNVKIAAYDSYGAQINYIVAPIKLVESAPQTWTPGRKASRKLTAYLPAFTVSGTSISNDERTMVVFAPGNLRAKLDTVPGPYIKSGAVSSSCRPVCFGTADEWRFAEHQYDALGTYIPDGRTKAVNTFVEGENGDYIDLFAFQGNENIPSMTLGYGYQFGIYYGSKDSYSNYLGTDGTTLKHDWGENEIAYGDFTYESNTWRTPSFSEWRHVLERRKYSSNLISHATKATLKSGGQVVAYGLIILPDHYSHPCGLDSLKNAYSQDNQTYLASEGGASESDNVIALEDWAKMEDAGCVFLPLTNMRSWDSTNLEPTLNNAGVGMYWSSSTRSGKYATALAFNCPSGGRDGAIGAATTGTSSLNSAYQRDRFYGIGVRLVRDIK